MNLMDKCQTQGCKAKARDLRDALEDVEAPPGESAEVIIEEPVDQDGPIIRVVCRGVDKKWEHEFGIGFPEMTIPEVVERVKEILNIRRTPRPG